MDCYITLTYLFYISYEPKLKYNYVFKYIILDYIDLVYIYINLYYTYIYITSILYSFANFNMRFSELDFKKDKAKFG